MNEACSFTVLGKPISKGSMRSLGRGRMTEQIPESAPWKERVHWEARREWGDKPPIEGPVVATMWFCFDPPKSAPKNRRTLPTTRATYDLDKLCRNILDAVTHVVIKDDAQIVDLNATKYYSGGDGVHAHPLLKRAGALVCLCEVTR